MKRVRIVEFGIRCAPFARWWYQLAGFDKVSNGQFSEVYAWVGPFCLYLRGIMFDDAP